MGFDVKTNISSEGEQLSLLDFQMPQADFIESSTPPSKMARTANDEEFEKWLAKVKSQPVNSPKTGRFVTLSASFHVAALVLMTIFTVPIVQDAKPETISIEIQDETPKTPVKQARGIEVPPTQGSSSPKPVEVTPPPVVDTAEGSAQDDDGAPEVAAAPIPAPAPVVALAPAKAAAPKVKVAAVKATRNVAPKMPVRAVPETLDDIDAPSLETGALAEAPVNTDMHEDLNQDFEKVDESQAAQIENERGRIDKATQQVEAEQEQSLKAVDEMNQEDAVRLAALKDSVHQKNAQAIASAQASEKAAADAAAANAAAKARAQAAAAAAAKARAEAAKKAQLAAAAQASKGTGSGSGSGNAAGAGAGSSGENTSGAEIAGIPQGVRSLDQLRQMPNNPIPQYENAERHAGQQGEISFVAYINKAGVPGQFKVIKSTGYRNLDAKTLAALKKWKFYPGQEGWVELPFKWDLRGGVQEDGGTLRRGIGSR